MKITAIGIGYVGLVTGACFAERGNEVWCVDVDSEKIEELKNGKIPIYEPGLERIVRENVEEGRLQFTTSLRETMVHTNILFIAVGTPSDGDGSADISAVMQVAREIGENLSEYSIIVDKSTVPVGTAERVKQTVQKELDKRGVSVAFDVVSNPEFLKEGNAVNDFMKPDRIIIGTDSDRARETLDNLYAPFSRHHDKIMHMGIRDAEMTKYAANAMLATKISFINEIANICDSLGVDVEHVRRGIGSDSRIGYSFIYPGPGFGGSCFPKDVDALIHLTEDREFEPLVLRSVRERNDRQKRVLFQKMTDHFGENLSGLTFAVWGLSFKPGTDDIRESPALVLLEQIIEAGGVVQAYDPAAMDTARKELPNEWFERGSMILFDDRYAAVKNADALVLVTEWKQFHEPDFSYLQESMNQPVIFDGRNQYQPEMLLEMGFTYFGIGRGNSTPQT